MDKRPALGKGLSALIPDAPPAAASGSLEVDIDRLSPNELQPRMQFDDAKLEELTRSIKDKGIIQPILVRPLAAGEYRIIAGERRWRAAQRAGLLKVPVVVREVADGSDQQLLELALIENVQRENLNPVDEAVGLSASRRSVLAHPGADCGGGRKGSEFGRQLHAAAQAA